MRSKIHLTTAAGGVAIGALLLTAPGAQGMTFKEACGITHGWYTVVAQANTEECHWQDPNTGNEWVRSNPLPVKPTVPPASVPGRSP
jgi:hypothetical protein